MAECNVSIAMKRIRSAERDSKIAVFINKEKPWLLNAVFDGTIETRRMISDDNGSWVGSFCKEDRLDVIERALNSVVKPHLKIPTAKDIGKQAQ